MHACLNKQVWKAASVTAFHEDAGYSEDSAHFLAVSQGRGFWGFLLKLTHGYCSQILPISQHGDLMETLSPAIAPGDQKDCREGKGLGPD